MMTLEPRLVVSLGAPATGKSTTLKEVCQKIDNAFYLDRDDILLGLLNVAPTITEELLSFEDYVNKDDVFPKNARYIETPFGMMIQVDPKNAFNRRHGRDQSYLIQAELSRTALALGKIPVLDCIVMRQIKDGTLRKFLDYDAFRGYSSFLVHFVADEEDCYNRILKKSKLNPESAIRDREMLKSKESFEKIIRGKHDMIPEELKNYEHLLVNTSEGTPEECAKKVIDYISR